MEYQNITDNQLKRVEDNLSSFFLTTTPIKLKANGGYYDSEYFKPDSKAGWWGNFISSFMIRVDKKVAKSERDPYLVANCHIYYKHPDGGENGLSFYLLKHKDGSLWKFFASYQEVL